ncbi:MAG: UvrB/UvrC motif-containing protein, partial [Phycisphaerales bacterium]|nr:UvrB/UvrC motif-containing protein [Phycisphaerales bacterium]
YEPGKVSVRKIIGRDGREKIQTRVDLGLLQLELDGRPDGKRPHGCESLLDYHERRLAEWLRENGADRGFVISSDECRDLHHEAYLYYQRFLATFVLADWDRVEADTSRNIRAIDMVGRFGATEHDRGMMEPQRPYTLMMGARALVYSALQYARYDDALTLCDEWIARLQEILAETDQSSRRFPNAEVRMLTDLRREVLERMPEDAPPRLQNELQLAIEAEAYERAAQLRDKLAKVLGRPVKPSRAP